MRTLDKRLAALEGNASGSYWADILDTLTDEQIDRLPDIIRAWPETLEGLDAVSNDDLRLLSALRLPFHVPDVAVLAEMKLLERAT